MINVFCKVNLGKGMAAGTILRVPELDTFLRRRLRDAKIDNCCELIADEDLEAKRAEIVAANAEPVKTSADVVEGMADAHKKKLASNTAAKKTAAKPARQKLST